MGLQQHPPIPLLGAQHVEELLVGIAFLIETTNMQGSSETTAHPCEILLDAISSQVAVVAVPARPHRRVIGNLKNPFDQR